MVVPKRIGLKDIDDKSLLYALRCVNNAASRGGTPETLGIGKLTLNRMVRVGLVLHEGWTYRISEHGVAWMNQNGGPFGK